MANSETYHYEMDRIIMHRLKDREQLTESEQQELTQLEIKVNKIAENKKNDYY